MEVQNSKNVLSLLSALCQARTATVVLQLESSTTAAGPVTLYDAGEQRLHLDLTTVPAAAAQIENGERFRLSGQADGALIHTPFLHAAALGELQFECEPPRSLTTTHRRRTFRAPLYEDMRTTVTLFTQAGQHFSGKLINLSIGGCLVELCAIATELADERDPVQLSVCFPNSERLQADGYIRHVHTEGTKAATLAGCEFIDDDPVFRRRIPYFVREVERQGARRAARYGLQLAPSRLFAAKPQQSE